MQEHKPRPSSPRDAAAPARPEKKGRSGRGVDSIIPHLKADQKAKAAARAAKRGWKSPAAE